MKPNIPDRKKTLKLKIEEKINFIIIGISSHENDYRLVWSINNQLNLQFVRVENLSVFNPKVNADVEFSKYLYNNEDKYLKFYLISNRCPDGFLFPQVKNFDYLVQIIGEINDEEIKELMKKMKSVSVISAVFLLPAEKLKGIGQILME